ncbi:MAG: hypothetical protein D6739_03775 [Nitrospirae bacterium]|nr:MAG: hypothetical protein D6739_03775 [Nitrospirota bacterium]
MFSVGGIATGLDTQAIIDALVKAERVPIDRLQAREKGFQDQVAALQELNGLLKKVQDAADALRQPDAPLQGRSATVANTSAVKVTVGDTTPVGSYTVDVTGLASAQILATPAGRFADTDTTAVGTGTLTIQVGSGSPVSVAIDSTNNTLAGIRDAINAADAGVTAAIVNDGGTNPYRLVLTANDPGTANTVTLTVSGDGDGNDTDDAGLSQLINANLVEVHPASDAKLTVNGISITSASNTVTDAIPGATLELLGKSNGTPAEVTVTASSEDLKAKLEDFVSAFNAVVDFNAAHNNPDNPGVLAGDFTLRSAVARLHSVALSLGHGSGAIQSLSHIGVRMDDSGKLSVDGAVLDDALASDPSAVEKVIRGDGTTTHGVFGALYDAVNAFTDPDVGAIQGRTDGLNANVKRINKQIDEAEVRIDAFRRRVTHQYMQLELLVNDLKSQGDSLLQALNNMPVVSRAKK